MRSRVGSGASLLSEPPRVVIPAFPSDSTRRTKVGSDYQRLSAAMPRAELLVYALPNRAHPAVPIVIQNMCKAYFFFVSRTDYQAPTSDRQASTTILASFVSRWCLGVLEVSETEGHAACRLRVARMQGARYEQMRRAASRVPHLSTTARSSWSRSR